MVAGVQHCPIHSTLMIAGKCGQCASEAEPRRGRPKNGSEGSLAIRAVVHLSASAKTKFLVDAISSGLGNGEFVRLYKNIVEGRAGFATAYFLAGSLAHRGHIVFLHPTTLDNIIKTESRYNSSGAFYSRVAMANVLCAHCQERGGPYGSLSLSSIRTNGEVSEPGIYSAFVRYLLASPEAVLGELDVPSGRRSHKKPR